MESDNQQRALAKERLARHSELNGSGSGLDHAVAAADLYMAAFRSATGAAQKTHLRGKIKQMVTLAEKLKSLQPPKPALPTQGTPENDILQGSSHLHGNSFDPWLHAPSDDQFCLQTGNKPYQDPCHFAMSDLQLSILDDWKRPSLLGGRQDHQDVDVQSALMSPRDVCDLVQDITTDCSVVASLCAAMRVLTLNTGSGPLLASLMYPFDLENDRPRVSENGKYIFKMHFNGCFREVVVDDRLPVSKADIGRNLFVVDRRNPHLLWPALMEKAYLKIRGGYDFPGSNSGTDLWVLTGWIPEQIFLQSDFANLDDAWDRIVKGFRDNTVVVTLGTSRLSSSEETTMGLVSEHDYAVLDLHEAHGVRHLLVKNPWCDGLVWKGAPTDEPTEAAVQMAAAAEKRLNLEEHGKPTDSAKGLFWISLGEVAQNFESMYLNWNPESSFPRREDHHFSWELPNEAMRRTLAQNPQYSMVSPTDSRVWILLSRHFADEELDITRNEKSASLADVARQLGYIGVSIFDNGGKRVQVSKSPSYTGPFVPSPQTLAKFDAKAGTAYTVVMTGDKLPLREYRCTFSFFSDAKLQVGKAQDELKFYREVQGSWTRRTSGGNASSGSYAQNPQFSVTVPRATPLSLLLCTGNPNVRIHADLVWSAGKRVSSIQRKDVLADTSDYRNNNVQLDVPIIEAGAYIVICSTFEPGQLANFTIRMGSNVACTVQPVPADSAGLLRSQAPPLIFAAGEWRKRTRINATRLTRAHVIAQQPESRSGSGQQRPRAAVRLSLRYGRGPQATLLAASDRGNYKELAVAVRTPEFDIEPDRLRYEELWLVVELLGNPRDRGKIEVEVLGDNLVQAGPWEVFDS